MIKHRLYPIIAFLLLLFVYGCAETPHILGVEENTFYSELYSGRFDLLKEIEFTDEALAELGSRYPELPFYLSYMLEEMEQPHLAARILWASYKNRKIYDAILIDRMYALFLKNEFWYDMEKLARHIIVNFEETPRHWYNYLHSLYRQDKFSQLLAELPDFTPESGMKAEADLWKMVAAYETGTDGWEQLFTDYFKNYYPNNQHRRAYTFLDSRNDAFDTFSVKEINYMAFKNGLSADDYDEVGRYFEALKRDSYSFSEMDIRLLYKYFSTQNLLTAGIGFYKDMQKSYDFSSREMSALLEHQKGSSANALEVFRALTQQAAVSGRKRLFRSAQDIAMSISAAKAVEELAYQVRLYGNAVLYSDQLEKMTHIIVKAKDWKSLHALFKLIDDRVSGYNRAHIGLLVYTAEKSGLLELSSGDKAAINDVFDKHAFMRRDYYHIVPGIINGKENPFTSLQYKAVAYEPDVQDSTGIENSRTEIHEFSLNYLNVAKGLFGFGLSDAAYKFIYKYRFHIAANDLYRFSEMFQAKDMYYESIRLAGAVLAKDSSFLSRNLLELLYPRGFQDIIDAAAEEFGVDKLLAYSMIREESLFSPTIGSHAGARGLGQLMPFTAEDMAQRIKLSDWSITDPEDNARMGLYFLSTLVERYGSPARALSGYNAGIGRARRWERSFKDSPEMLYTDSLEYFETRYYIKKITATAVFYGFLYYDMEPIDVVYYMYPELK